MLKLKVLNPEIRINPKFPMYGYNGENVNLPAYQAFSLKQSTLKEKNVLHREHILFFYHRPLFRREVTTILTELPPLKVYP